MSELFDTGINDSLSDSSTPDTAPSYGMLPSYIVATDNHAAANGDMSLTDALISGIKTGAGIGAGAAIGQALIPIPIVGAAIGAAVGGVTGYTDGKFTAVAAISGVSSFYNSGVAIANIAGADFKPADVNEWMASVDSSLPSYYAENKEAADLAGFAVGSFIPGLAGVKAYNMGAKALLASRAGAVGANTGEAIGLLGGTQARLLALAESEMTASGATFNYLNTNLLKSIALGAGEQAIQAAVFETAVATTMFKSPVLENEDFSDIAKNVLTGAIFGGVLGGGLEAAVSVFKLRNAISTSDKLLRPLEGIGAGVPQGISPSERLILSREVQDNVPKPEMLDLGGKDFGDRPQRLFQATMRRLPDERAIIMQELGGGDAYLANSMHAIAERSTNAQEMADKFLGMKKFQAITSVAKSKLGETEQLSHVRLWGEGADEVVEGLPKIRTLHDTLGANQSIVTSTSGITVGKKAYKFSANKSVNTAELSVHQAQAREIWALHSPELKPTAAIGEADIALLSKAYRQAKAGKDISKMVIKDISGKVKSTGHNTESIYNLVVEAKQRVANDLLYGSVNDIIKSNPIDAEVKLANSLDGTVVGTAPAPHVVAANTRMSSEEVALITNVRLGNIEGTAVNTANPLSDIFAMESHAAEYATKLSGIRTPLATLTPKELLLRPQTVATVHDSAILGAMDRNQLDAVVAIKSRQKLLIQEADRAVTKVLGNLAEQIPPIPEKVLYDVSRNGAGATTIAPANAGYNTAAGYFQRSGTVTSRMMQDATKRISETLDPIMHKLAGDFNATLELSTLMRDIRSTPEIYVLDDTGTKLILRGEVDYLSKLSAGKKPKPYVKIDPKAADEIPLASGLVQELVAKHIEANGSRLDKFATLRSVGGTVERIDARTLYFPPPDLKDYTHFAFVTDPSITGSGHMKMIHATSADHLEQLITKVPAEFQSGVIKAPTVSTAGDIERWHKAIGDYNRDETISENYMNAALHRSGASAPYFLRTDSELIIKELRNWHIGKERQLVREGVSLKYAKEFEELKRLDEQHVNIATSTPRRFSISQRAAESVGSPYMSYVRTALDIPNSEAIPFRTFQTSLDTKVSKVWNSITEATMKTTKPEDLDKINKLMGNAGVSSAYYNAATVALVNESVPNGALSTFTRRANALIGAVTLAPDVLNAVNNVVGSVVMHSTEFASVVQAINRGDESAVGALAGLAHVKIPGTQHSILSPSKIFAQNIRDWFNPALREYHKAQGFAGSKMYEIQAIEDMLSVPELHTVADLNSRIASAHAMAMKFFDKAAKLSMNKLAEEFTHFMAANTMKQLTDVAVNHGLMSPKLAGSYIETFSNRVNGQYHAAFRPMMFHGSVGQAAGLFQTYQVNMLQQLLRHVTAGEKKTVAMMMGAQGTIYGMNGLPGFHAANTYLVGQLSGNETHRDIYSELYRSVDKEHADWMMYGGMSNIMGLLSPDLKSNMYVRGDINPRQLTIVPLNPVDVPLVQASAKFFGNLLDTAGKLGSGADVTSTILQGIEHNGVSRPLAGLAQVLEGLTNPQGLSYSTTGSGNLIGANDLLSLTTATRLFGAKPLDEAKASDKAFRSIVYNASDAARRKKLGEVIKSKVIGGRDLDEQDLHTFATQYAKAGGKQEGFNKFYMGVMKEANVAGSNRIAKNLKSYDSQRMQELLGGTAIDFSNSPSE